MKIGIVLLIGFILGGLKVCAQEPVQWSYTAKAVSSDTYKVDIEALIEDGWHLYAQKQPDNAIAVPTTIDFIKSPLLELQGATREIGNLDQHTDPTLGISANQYMHKVDFVQVVKLKSKAQTNITGSIKFQVCTDQECLPPAVTHFAIPLKG